MRFLKLHKLVFTLLFLVVSLNLTMYTKVYAQELDETEAKELIINQLDTVDFSQMQEAIDAQTGDKFSFRDTVEKAISGQLDISPQNILKQLANMIFYEVKQNGALMRNLLIIGILSALLKSLTDSFQLGVGKLGSFVCYIMLVATLFLAFQTAAAYVLELIYTLTTFMEASIPLVLSLVVMGGNVGAPFVFSPLLFFATTMVSAFIAGCLVPLMVLGASVAIVNYIAEKPLLTSFSTLIETVCGWSLKGIAIGFVGVLSLAKIASPILTNVALKTAKVAVSTVPVVGGVLNGAWDMLYIFAGAIKSGVIVAFVVAIVLICAGVVVKLLVIILTFKLTSALIQPLCDEKIVLCIESISGFLMLLLGALTTVTVMFVLSVVILLSF